MRVSEWEAADWIRGSVEGVEEKVVSLVKNVVCRGFVICEMVVRLFCLMASMRWFVPAMIALRLSMGSLMRLRADFVKAAWRSSGVQSRRSFSEMLCAKSLRVL